MKPRSDRPRRRHRACRPLMEMLENRALLAVGLFTEDFKDDLGISPYPAFDSWDADPATVHPDELHIQNNLPWYGLSGYGPVLGGGYYQFQTIFSSLDMPPSGPPALVIYGTGTTATVSFSFPAPGTPGGHAVDEEVAVVGLTVKGLAKLRVQSEAGRSLLMDISTSSWERIVVGRDHLLDDGLELGGISGFTLYVQEAIGINDVTALVLFSETNAPPVAVDDLYLVQRHYDQSELFSPTANDHDPENDGFTLVSHTLPAHGELVDHENGFFTYLPEPGFLGDDHFEYTIRDEGGATDTATVTLRVNTPPVPQADLYTLPHGYSGPFTTSFPGYWLLANDRDADGDPLSVVAIEGPALGELTVAPDGSFTYTPTTPDGRVRDDSFTYTVTDGTFTSAPVPVTIRVENGLPVVADQSASISHGFIDSLGRPIVLRTPYWNPNTIGRPDDPETQPYRGLVDFSDPEGDPLDFEIVSGPDHGSLVVNGGLAPVGLSTALEFEYRPEGGRFVGSDRFTYRLFDGYGHSVVTSFELRVPNNTPVPIPDHFYQPWEKLWEQGMEGSVSYHFHSGSEDSHGEPEVIDFRLASESVAAHFNNNWGASAGYDIADFDPDFDRLTYWIVSQPAFGEVFMDNDGDFYYLPGPGGFPRRDAETGLVREDLPRGFLGYDTFEYEVSDGHSSSRAVVVIESIDPYDDLGTNLPDHGLHNEIIEGDFDFDRVYEVHGAWLEFPLGERSGWFAEDGYLATPKSGPYVFDGPSHGSLSFDGYGNFTYRPDPGFIGLDFLRWRGVYEWSDFRSYLDPRLEGTGFEQGLVSFIVGNYPNDPPPTRRPRCGTTTTGRKQTRT